MTTPSNDINSSVLFSAVPRHIAIIMDGNNRWAKQKNQRGLAGHRAGATAAREMVKACRERGIEILTLFAFSSENWDRPPREVKGLMALFISVLQRDEIRQLHENNIRVRFIGRRDRFNSRLQRLMKDAEEKTASNTAMTVVVAADYGGKWDIAEAARQLIVDSGSKDLALSNLSSENLEKYLSLADFPDPDLCIRTGGEQRISNFLLWQFAYSELYFTDAYWPDFGPQALDLALVDFEQRQRRFGKTSEQVDAELPSNGDKQC